MRSTGRAIGDFEMIRAHDRILLGLSGGKDSLSLLQVLLALRERAPIPFSLAAATVDPQFEGFDPRPLKAYLARLDVPYYFESQAIMARAQKTMGNDSFCAYCARMRRGVLYACARREGYNVLVLAQHLDDLAESFLLSIFHGGSLRTMKAHYLNDAGDVRVARPLVYVRERQLADFAQRAGLPVIKDNCPACFRQPTQRAYIKGLLAAQEAAQPRLFANLLAAMRPLMATHGRENTVTNGSNHALPAIDSRRSA